MALIRSALLGLAAGLAAGAIAEAADLPSGKAAPAAEYVRICNVGGVTGWVLPGSDICVKLSGYMTAQFAGGGLSTQYNFAFGDELSPEINGYTGQRILVAASAAQQNTIFDRDAIGWLTRGDFGSDFASNTAYGPLIGHFDLYGEMGNGFDNLGTDVYVNTAYVTWAGVTAGKAGSFFSFTNGGDAWANFFSPDRRGFNEPPLLAYTASLGGGWSATLSFESPASAGASGVGTDISICNGVSCNITFGGQRWPDVVGALHITQAWGEAQLSGVLHYVNVQDSIFTPGLNACGVSGALPCNAQQNTFGWGVDAGFKIYLPWSSVFLVTGALSRNAVWYSGLPEGMWGENGQVNGNGQPMFMADAAFDPVANAWATPTAWSVAAILEHRFNRAFYVDLEGSIGGLAWSNQRGGCPVPDVGCGGAMTGGLSPHATSWILGADLGWNAAANLSFDVELMYENTVQARPNGLIGTVYNWDGQDGVGATFAPGAWDARSSGFASRLRITRYF
jgi:hypothetical protein